MFEHYKTLDGDTDAKLGAHVFAPHAEQVNNQPTLASATIGAPASFPNSAFTYPRRHPTWSTCLAEPRVRRPARSRPSSSRPRSWRAAGLT
jgi:hypothetical protein